MKPACGIVTGAASGIGRAVVDRMLDEGIVVVGVDIDEVKLTQIADYDWLWHSPRVQPHPAVK